MEGYGILREGAQVHSARSIGAVGGTLGSRPLCSLLVLNAANASELFAGPRADALCGQHLQYSMPEGIGAVCGGEPDPDRPARHVLNAQRHRSCLRRIRACWHPCYRMVHNARRHLSVLWSLTVDVRVGLLEVHNARRHLSCLQHLFATNERAIEECPTPEGIGAICGGEGPEHGAQGLHMLNARRHRSCLRTTPVRARPDSRNAQRLKASELPAGLRSCGVRARESCSTPEAIGAVCGL